MQLVNLELGQQSYRIHISSGLFSDVQLLKQNISSQKVFIVTNETVAELYLEKLIHAFSTLEVDVLRLPDGEQFKTLASLELIISSLLRHRHSRQTTIVALGGGVVGDLAGFAAATYQRGVNFIQIPTTLLAQVDSSVGGKTGVNHPLGKNMIGAFYQPKAVYIDPDTLKTLPAKEFSAGMAEVIKTALLADKAFFYWLEDNSEQILAQYPPVIEYAIKRCCEIKAAIVSQDEREGGIRALLNLGHTFGHAIETHQGYGQWLHGEAVATGLVMAADLSVRLKLLETADASRIKSLVERFGLPTCPPENMTIADFLALMSVDKKVLEGHIRFVLLTSIGVSTIVDDVPLTSLQQCLGANKALCEQD